MTKNYASREKTYYICIRFRNMNTVGIKLLDPHSKNRLADPLLKAGLSEPHTKTKWNKTLILYQLFINANFSPTFSPNLPILN